MPYALTETLSRFASSLVYEDIPEEAVVAACMGWTNCTVAILGGQHLPSVKFIYDALVKDSAGTEARLFFGSETATSAEAALINGAAAHALDLDDIALRGSHPSAVLVPAILAEAERMNASGRDAVTAYTAGFEVWGRLIDRESDFYVKKGWHTTCVIGTVAATAALANLKRLSAEQTMNAMAAAVSCSAGPVAGWFGEMKPFQVGRAAQSAVISVKLAEAGMFGAKEPLLGLGGLLLALSPKGNVDTDSPVEDLGERFQLMEKGLHTKFYPFPLSLHRAIEGAIHLVRTHDFMPSDVRKITAYIGPAQQEYLDASHGTMVVPIDKSIELAMAAAIVARRSSLAELKPEFYERDDVKKMMTLLEKEIDDSIADDPEPNMGFAGRVRIELRDGREFVSEDETYYPGHWTRRLTEDQWREKFDTFAGEAIEEAGLDGILESVRNINELSSVRELFKTK